MSAMETETSPLSDAVASAWDTEIAPPCDCATSDGGGLHLTFVDDPGLANLHKDQMRASAIIAALMRAARDGGVSILLSLNTVSFEWRDVNDALFVFEAITERREG